MVKVINFIVLILFVFMLVYLYTKYGVDISYCEDKIYIIKDVDDVSHIIKIKEESWLIDLKFYFKLLQGSILSFIILKIIGFPV